MKIWGTVVNTKFLQIAGAKAAVITVSALPVIFALMTTAQEARSTSECAINESQREALQLAGQMLKQTAAFANASLCLYNETEVLRHLWAG